MMMRAFVVLLSMTSVLLLQGCSSSGSQDELRQQIEAIRKKPRGKVDPPPEFLPHSTFTYAAHQLRSPFAKPMDVEMVDLTNAKQVQPDLNRVPEYLEKFPLEALHYKGQLSKPNEAIGALIEDGQGATHRVKIGHYMGKSFGRIVDVSESQISLIEIVPDGHDGWVERPRILLLAD